MNSSAARPPTPEGPGSVSGRLVMPWLARARHRPSPVLREVQSYG